MTTIILSIIAILGIAYMWYKINVIEPVDEEQKNNHS